MTFSATVYVAVSDGKGKKPLPGANILLRKEGEPLNQALRGITNGEGKIQFQPRAAGSYTLLVTSNGYKSLGKKLTIQAMGENRAELVLVAGSTVEANNLSPKAQGVLDIHVWENFGEKDTPWKGANWF